MKHYREGCWHISIVLTAERNTRVDTPRNEFQNIQKVRVGFEGKLKQEVYRYFHNYNFNQWGINIVIQNYISCLDTIRVNIPILNTKSCTRS